MLSPVKVVPLAPVLEDLAIRADRVRTIGDPPTVERAEGRTAVVAVARGAPSAAAAEEIVAFATRETSGSGVLLVFLEGQRDSGELAALRNGLWPFAHVVAHYELSNQRIVKTTVDGAEKLPRGSGLRGSLLVARRRETVFDPAATVVKFDRNAPGWNGSPGTPGYAHFRWMRRYVAAFVPEETARAARRILDFGCGAGWVGIEAALRAREAELAAFDPSPEMVRLAEENARASGIARFTGRTGFGEEPPFPAAGEPAFDLVFSSGVVSFSGDAERWYDGLAATLAPGATLVIGDINRDSDGMRRRREQKPLLPLREINASTREEARAALERRGLAFEAWAGYQRTWPIPQAMHYDATRLKGVLSRPLLWLNQASSALDARTGAAHPERFDSWVLRMKAH